MYILFRRAGKGSKNERVPVNVKKLTHSCLGQVYYQTLYGSEIPSFFHTYLHFDNRRVLLTSVQQQVDAATGFPTPGTAPLTFFWLRDSVALSVL